MNPIWSMSIEIIAIILSWLLVKPLIFIIRPLINSILYIVYYDIMIVKKKLSINE